MPPIRHDVDAGAGWILAVDQHLPTRAPKRPRPPLLFVPGYGMNGFVLDYHPSGRSLVGTLVDAGFECWVANLRGQDPSRLAGGSALYGMRDLALVDLPAVARHALAHTRTGHDRLTLLGCSLGATIAMIWLGLSPDAPVGAFVNVGGPLRWVEVYPLLKRVFACPTLIGLVPMAHTRALARFALPWLVHLPGLLSIYMHPDLIDMSKADEFVATVSDPNRRLNREIAVWMKARDLEVDGQNVSQAFTGNRLPVLCVVANADGIVPPATAMYPREVSAADTRDVLWVGDEQAHYAHADLYLSHRAVPDFFDPLATWLKKHASGQ